MKIVVFLEWGGRGSTWPVEFLAATSPIFSAFQRPNLLHSPPHFFFPLRPQSSLFPCPHQSTFYTNHDPHIPFAWIISLLPTKSAPHRGNVAPIPTPLVCTLSWIQWFIHGCCRVVSSMALMFFANIGMSSKASTRSPIPLVVTQSGKHMRSHGYGFTQRTLIFELIKKSNRLLVMLFLLFLLLKMMTHPRMFPK